MQYILRAPKVLKGEINLPASKSISNRALILNALSNANAIGTGKTDCAIKNLADCDDTNVLIVALRLEGNQMDIGAAGTAMRFLTAFLAGKEGSWEITGSERMRNRPIKILVNALNSLGAEIHYMEKDGFPPLKIKGKKLIGGEITIDGGISSQYLSALMMAAPTMEKGLRLYIRGELISRPYVRMTLEMMRQYGVQTEWTESYLDIQPQKYHPIPYIVESDWSGASYWYQMLSLAKEGTILLKGLFARSLQGDARVATWFEDLGVQTEYVAEGVKLIKTDVKVTSFEADFTDQPDLAQTFAVTCALKGIHFHLSGLQSLKIKETDRIQALINEGMKLGFVFTVKNNCILEWSGERCEYDTNTIIDTYEDHRMAMAFAPAALAMEGIRINHPEVVSKSYPSYWKDLISCGFTIDSKE